MSTLLVAALAAAVTTSAQLKVDHGRFPIGANSSRAAGHWVGLILLDALVAVGAVFGTLPVDGIDDAGAAGLLRAGVVGVLAPLALRSPVRSASVAGSEQKVGITYVYDAARLRLDLALDERMTRLRRHDVTVAVKALECVGWTSALVAPRIAEHIRDRRKIDDETKDAVLGAVANSQTLPSEPERLAGLANALLTHRLSGLLDELRSTNPPANEVDADDDEPIEEPDDESDETSP